MPEHHTVKLTPPIPVWTEAQIRAALKGHGTSTDGSCKCTWTIHPGYTGDFNVDHVVDLLKLFHLGAT
jgi:hypothetical protein